MNVRGDKVAAHAAEHRNYFQNVFSPDSHWRRRPRAPVRAEQEAMSAEDDYRDACWLLRWPADNDGEAGERQRKEIINVKRITKHNKRVCVCECRLENKGALREREKKARAMV